MRLRRETQGWQTREGEAKAETARDTQMHRRGRQTQAHTIKSQHSGNADEAYLGILCSLLATFR